MGTITHTFDPAQAVYLIVPCLKTTGYVSPGTVVQVKAEALVSGVTIKYDVRLPGSGGTQEFVESDIFIDKPTAIAEYNSRVD